MDVGVAEHNYGLEETCKLSFLRNGCLKGFPTANFRSLMRDVASSLSSFSYSSKIFNLDGITKLRNRIIATDEVLWGQSVLRLVNAL